MIRFFGITARVLPAAGRDHPVETRGVARTQGLLVGQFLAKEGAATGREVVGHLLEFPLQGVLPVVPIEPGAAVVTAVVAGDSLPAS